MAFEQQVIDDAHVSLKFIIEQHLNDESTATAARLKAILTNLSASLLILAPPTPPSSPFDTPTEPTNQAVNDTHDITIAKHQLVAVSMYLASRIATAETFAELPILNHRLDDNVFTVGKKTRKRFQGSAREFCTQAFYQPIDADKTRLHKRHERVYRLAALVFILIPMVAAFTLILTSPLTVPYLALAASIMTIGTLTYHALKEQDINLINASDVKKHTIDDKDIPDIIYPKSYGALFGLFRPRLEQDTVKNVVLNLGETLSVPQR